MSLLEGPERSSEDDNQTIDGALNKTQGDYNSTYISKYSAFNNNTSTLQMNKQPIAIPAAGSEYSCNSQLDEGKLTNEEDLYE
jgi:hypothetical protein